MYIWVSNTPTHTFSFFNILNKALRNLKKPQITSNTYLMAKNSRQAQWEVEATSKIKAVARLLTFSIRSFQLTSYLQMGTETTGGKGCEGTLRWNRVLVWKEHRSDQQLHKCDSTLHTAVFQCLSRQGRHSDFLYLFIFLRPQNLSKWFGKPFIYRNCFL